MLLLFQSISLCFIRIYVVDISPNTMFNLLLSQFSDIVTSDVVVLIFRSSFYFLISNISLILSIFFFKYLNNVIYKLVIYFYVFSGISSISVSDSIDWIFSWWWVTCSCFLAYLVILTGYWTLWWSLCWRSGFCCLTRRAAGLSFNK